MSKYIKKHRYQFAGVALPLFLLFVLFAVGASIFPGWIKPSYGTPGASCVSLSTDSADPLLTACNVCAGEFCSGTGITPGTCSVGATPCPAQGEDPGCWNNCTGTVFLDTILSSTVNTFGFNTQCQPNNSFCSSKSGGTQANSCRTGTCTSTQAFDPANPSGCIYDLSNAANCILCATPAPTTFNHCGNGICEPGLGENCTSCAADCLLPGFTDTCPLTSGTTITQACEQPTITFVTFDGPPYNVRFSGTCEDGDLCTDNTCVAGPPIAVSFTCQATPKVCSINTGDFCCPAGCNPPASGGTCGANDSTCDIDCFTPQQCIPPTPTPIPIPTPPFSRCLQGDGISSSRSDLNCDGFTCALDPQAQGPSRGSHGLLAGAVIALALGLGLRRQKALKQDH